MELIDLIQWWNLIFELPLFLAVFLLVMQASGLLHDSDNDVEVDSDVDLGHDYDLDHDYDHDHDFEQGNGGNVLQWALDLLGIGRVPLTIIVMSILILWGAIGFTANWLSPFPEFTWWISALLAGGGSIFLTGALARVMSKVMPTSETYGSTRYDLIGKIGETRFQLTDGTGEVIVHDSHGNLLQVVCRLDMDVQSIPKNTRVVLTEYDAANDVYRVAPYQEEVE